MFCFVEGSFEGPETSKSGWEAVAGRAGRAVRPNLMVRRGEGKRSSRSPARGVRPREGRGKG